MKWLIIIGLVLFSVWGCTHQKEIIKSQRTSPELMKDSTEYEITIIDPDFERWYMLHYSPDKDRSNDYYRSMNSKGVSNWNGYYNSNRYNNVVGSFINYNPSEDYGIEVNRRLYWYFRYAEENYRIQLLR